jgi:hypothetical protein
VLLAILRNVPITRAAEQFKISPPRLVQSLVDALDRSCDYWEIGKRRSPGVLHDVHITDKTDSAGCPR